MKLIVLLIFRILRHHDVITIYIEHMSSDFISEYQIYYVCCISTHNVEYRLRCEPKRTSNFSTIRLNKSGNRKRTSRSSSFLFSVMGSLEKLFSIFSGFCSAVSKIIRKH